MLLTRDKTAEWRLEKGGPGGERSGALSEGKQSADEAREDARATSAEHSEAGSASSGPGQQLGRKNDLLVWLRLSATQRHVYEAFLNSASVHAALNQANSPLAALTGDGRLWPAWTGKDVGVRARVGLGRTREGQRNVGPSPFQCSKRSATTRRC